ncbi:MAG: response regulator [Candidatus Omnitrophota bacterium]|nr:response regulator [Candidatus Omnitrophota bacterium]
MGAHEFMYTNGTRLLFVGDELDFVVIRERMRKFDCNVEFALTGREALLKLETNHYGACLIAVMATSMDFVQVASIIRDEVHQKIPIIVMSESLSEDYRNRILAGGVRACVERPWDDRAMAAVVETIRHHGNDE